MKKTFALLLAVLMLLAAVQSSVMAFNRDDAETPVTPPSTGSDSVENEFKLELKTEEGTDEKQLVFEDNDNLYHLYIGKENDEVKNCKVTITANNVPEGAQLSWQYTEDSLEYISIEDTNEPYIISIETMNKFTNENNKIEIKATANSESACCQLVVEPFPTTIEGVYYSIDTDENLIINKEVALNLDEEKSLSVKINPLAYYKYTYLKWTLPDDTKNIALDPDDSNSSATVTAKDIVPNTANILITDTNSKYEYKFKVVISLPILYKYANDETQPIISNTKIELRCGGNTTPYAESIKLKAYESNSTNAIDFNAIYWVCSDTSTADFEESPAEGREVTLVVNPNVYTKINHEDFKPITITVYKDFNDANMGQSCLASFKINVTHIEPTWDLVIKEGVITRTSRSVMASDKEEAYNFSFTAQHGGKNIDSTDSQILWFSNDNGIVSIAHKNESGTDGNISSCRIKSAHTKKDKNSTEIVCLATINGELHAGVCTINVFNCGDVNCDDKINTADAVLILKHAAGLFIFSNLETQLADTDANGQVNTTDAVILLKYAAGLITDIPPKGGSTTGNDAQ